MIHVVKARIDQAESSVKRHPAVEWALQTEFSPSQVDCTTAVALKILDNKCKMLLGEKAAVMAIYDVVKHYPAELFDDEVHQIYPVGRPDRGHSCLFDDHHYALDL